MVIFFLQYIINDKLNPDDLNDETNLFLTLTNEDYTISRQYKWAKRDFNHF